KKRVLFLCTGNSCRSQMAEGLLRSFAGDQFEVYSAGVNPTHVHPLAITVMQEIGIDISHHWSKSVDEFFDQEFDYVITLCDDARQTCPFFPGAHELLHWSLPDPAGAQGTEDEKLALFRTVRDRIRQLVINLTESAS
ncbi:MAG TPA: arsenate reductase ArsC, partial [Thermodesulfobacteriota bacterium]|nr:arsenate reductase ArsC [Thermodesulfobacteriota bacterium]